MDTEIQKNQEEIILIIKQTVKESIAEEFEKIRLEMIPEVSDEEMNEIKNTFGSPDNTIAFTEELTV